ncbi:LysM domain-containing protein [Actinomadura sp. KC216]|uniref:LysM domain-containing protein n=1 Tax=Actinomadura sp. KC216 TaxID=2530370 RepID=UPI0010509DD1|nr:LysM domain-containing protein [Actinomadura sp. KC216]TDB87408.1 LysM domain-containing protein [Actinomadura sp. KC216]
MTDPLQALVAAGALPAGRFPPGSRYAATPVLTHDPGGGRRPVAYLARRLVPQPERLATVGEHTVVEGDRLDLLAGRHLGDPELWWRIADANVAAHPDELTAHLGRRLRLTAPEGIPGVADA